VSGGDPPALDVAWSRSPPARVFRGAVLGGVFDPLMSIYTKRTVRGREHLDGIEPPVVFVANHSSHMDTPAVLRALPARWRRRTVVAAAADYFYKSRRLGWTVSLVFGTVPVARDGRGLDEESTAHIRELFENGWSLVMYAEGTRSRDGNIGRLRSGAAVLAAQHNLCLVPIHMSGSHKVMPVGRSWPKFQRGFKRYPVEIDIGAPIQPTDDEHRSEVMERVRVHLESS
jgi:1-acyl-sn-glycerol-3-phosphate acyltransferase